MRDIERPKGFDLVSETIEQERSASGKVFERRRKRMLRVAALCLLSVYLFAGAPKSYGQCTLHVPPSCQGLLTEYNNLVAERNDLSDQLKKAAGSEKSSIANQIKKLLPQITAAKNKLDACSSAKGKKDLSASFSGTATMTTNNSNVKGPFVEKISIGMIYLAFLHDQFVINSFPAITVGPFDTPAGSNTTTVSLVKADCGAADPKTGKLTVTLSLHFHESLLLAKDSDLTITISTENAGGSRLNSGGSVTLVGDGTFSGGYLDGNTTHLVVKGTLLPLP